MVSLKTHNIMDYVAGSALILCPFLFGFSELDAARNVFILSGFFLFLYSLFTNYEYAILRVIPLGVHMTLDVLNGLLIFLAPWIFNYRGFLSVGQEYLHYVVAVGVFVLVGLTREKTEADKRLHGIHFKTTPAH